MVGRALISPHQAILGSPATCRQLIQQCKALRAIPTDLYLRKSTDSLPSDIDRGSAWVCQSIPPSPKERSRDDSAALHAEIRQQEPKHMSKSQHPGPPQQLPDHHQVIKAGKEEKEV